MLYLDFCESNAFGKELRDTAHGRSSRLREWEEAVKEAIRYTLWSRVGKKMLEAHELAAFLAWDSQGVEGLVPYEIREVI